MARRSQLRQSKRKTGTTKSRSTRRTRPAEPEPQTPWGRWLQARRSRREAKQRERERRRAARRARRRRWVLRQQRQIARALVFLVLLVGACGIGAGVLLVGGRPYPWEAIREINEVMSVATRLEDNRARWESLAVDHYLIDIEYTDDSGTWCGPGTVEVLSGRVVSLPSASETHWTPPETCEALMDELIPGAAFDWLEARLGDYQPGDSNLRVEFNPEFGNLRYAEASTYGERAPGCCWRADWRKLRLLYEE